jgi:small GTP-binding protein
MAEEENPNVSKSVKVAVLGPGAVGKSALTIRFVQDEFVPDYDPTIEDSYTKMVKVDRSTYKMQILDTAGQEEFLSQRDAWIRESDAYLLVYDMTNAQTFAKIREIYDRILLVREDDIGNSPKKKAQPGMVLCGNKCDLENKRKVSKAQGQSLATELGMSFFEVSAKEAINNELCFEEAVRLHLKFLEQKSLEEDDEEEEESGCSCAVL